MKNSGKMKKKTIQVAIVIALTFAFVGMLIGTEVYAEVHNGIVSVLCLSCIKLDPTTSADFTFETATEEDHPDFIIENLTEGIVFLHFSGDACHACEVMHPVISRLFYPPEPSRPETRFLSLRSEAGHPVRLIRY